MGTWHKCALLTAEMTELAGAAPDEKSSPVQKAVATAVTIPDVPSEIEKRTGYCLVMCTYSVLRYWERRGALRREAV